MNPFEFVLAIIILVFAFSIIRHKLGIQDRHGPAMPFGGPDDRETERLKEQVQRLQERIRVLERIVTDSGIQTAAQIEALRDRDRIAEDETNG